MIVDEELICSKIFALVGEVAWMKGDPPEEKKFVTTSRRVKLFSEVDASQQPACFQADHIDVEQQRTNMPYKSTMLLYWIIYQCVGKDQKAIGSTENNLILGACRRALAPKISDPGWADERNTLGGLVYHCYIDGQIFKDPGDIDDQGMIVIPIKVLVP